MKNEMLYGHEYDFETLEDLERAMYEYINYYNNKRIMTKLKGLTHIMYRHQSNNQVILSCFYFSPTYGGHHKNF